VAQNDVPIAQTIQQKFWSTFWGRWQVPRAVPLVAPRKVRNPPLADLQKNRKLLKNILKSKEMCDTIIRKKKYESEV
jgi:hypothetical protein